MHSDLVIKEQRVYELIDKLNLSGILLSKQTNFLWFTGGNRNDVIKNEDISLVYLFITKDNKYLISTNSDKERVCNEELDKKGFESIVYDWYCQDVFDALKKIGITKNIGGDLQHPNILYIENNLADIRRNLTGDEIKKLRNLADEYSKLLTKFCLNLKPGLTEKQIANNLIYECLKKDIKMPVLMVGSDERVFKYRHPVVTDKKVYKYFILATVAERSGLNISLSRCVYFGKTPKELNSKIESVNYIEAVYCCNSLPDKTLKELFEVGKKAYAKAGYPDEWKNHTQGGIIGYRPREFIANSSSKVKIKSNNALSWNPTIKGVKAEDVILVKEREVEQLTIDKKWPYIEIDINGKQFLKPKILEI